MGTFKSLTIEPFLRKIDCLCWILLRDFERVHNYLTSVYLTVIFIHCTCIDAIDPRTRWSIGAFHAVMIVLNSDNLVLLLCWSSSGSPIFRYLYIFKRISWSLDVLMLMLPPPPPLPSDINLSVVHKNMNSIGNSIIMFMYWTGAEKTKTKWLYCVNNVIAFHVHVFFYDSHNFDVCIMYYNVKM